MSFADRESRVVEVELQSRRAGGGSGRGSGSGAGAGAAPPPRQPSPQSPSALRFRRWRVLCWRRPLLGAAAGRRLALPAALRRLCVYELALAALALLVLGLVIAVSAVPYLGVAGCAARKRRADCERLGYRLKKFGQHLGGLLHVLVALSLLLVSRRALASYCGLPFKLLNQWHRWTGRVVAALSALHGLLFLLEWTVQGTLSQKLSTGENFAGFAALLALLLVNFTSLAAARRASYGVFWATHVVMVPLFLGGLLVHHHGAAFAGWAALPLLLLLGERAVRVREAVGQAWKVEATRKIGRSVLRVRLARSDVLVQRPMPAKDCGWLLLRIPAVSAWSAHPFSLCDADVRAQERRRRAQEGGDENGDRHGAHRHGAHRHGGRGGDADEDEDADDVGSEAEEAGEEEGMVSSTGRRCVVYVQASEEWAPTWTRSVVRHPSLVGQRAVVDGPFGALELPFPLHQYGQVLLFAGGIGITSLLPLLLRHRHGHGHGHGRRGVLQLTWAVRAPALATEFAAALREAAASSTPAAPVVVRVFVTDPDKLLLHVAGTSELTQAQAQAHLAEALGPRVALVFGSRPDFEAEVASARTEAVAASPGAGALGALVAAVTCGPAAMQMEAAEAVARSATNAHVHFETFAL